MAHLPLVVVTGSSGLLGTALCRRLRDNYTVVGMDNSAPKDEGTVARYIYIDLTTKESVAQSFHELSEHFGLNVASFVHLAAYHEFSGEDNALYRKVSIEGTQRLLHHLQHFDVSQFVFSSTMLVHKPTEPGTPINENWPIEPKWPHPQSKVDTEFAIEENHGKVPVAILRLAGFYDEMCHSIPISYQIKRILERRATAMVFPGNIQHGEPYVHIDDAIEAFVKTIEHRHDLPEEFVALIGEEEVVTFDERQRMIAKHLHGENGDDWVTREIPKAIAKAGTWLEEHTAYDDGDPFTAGFAVDLAGDHFELDICRAKDQLGWSPKHRLRDTLPTIIANLKRNPVAWYEENNLEINETVREFAGKKSWR